MNQHIPQAIIMFFINITSFVQINQLEKDHSMIKTHLKHQNMLLFFSNVITNSDSNKKVTYIQKL